MKAISSKLALMGACALSICIHLFPFVFHSRNPLGYDTGFYRRYLIEPFLSFPNAVVPGLGSDALIPRIIFDSLRLFHLPPDFILYGTLILFSACLPALLYAAVSRTLGTRAALIAAYLIAFSAIQYFGFWFMLWKNIWALVVLLSIFILFERKKFVPVLVLDIVLALSHQTTTIIYIAALACMLVTDRKRWREILIHIAVTSAAFLFVHQHVVVGLSRVTPVGVFLDLREYALMSLPVLIAAAFGLWDFARRKTWPPLAGLMIVGAAFPLFHLPFYERIFIFTDIGAVILAARGIDLLLSRIDSIDLKNANAAKKIYAPLAALIIFWAFVAGILWNQMRLLKPLVVESQIMEIEEIARAIAPGATILTTTDEAPWFEGWTRAHIAAPGMLQDTHNEEEWETVWSAASSTAEKTTFLHSFNKPGYISTFGNLEDLIGTVPACVLKIRENLYENGC